MNKRWVLFGIMLLIGTMLSGCLWYVGPPYSRRHFYHRYEYRQPHHPDSHGWADSQGWDGHRQGPQRRDFYR